MRKSPAVTVLMPVRNAQATLNECLDSIRAQSFTDYELLAVDDGSSDDSVALLRRYAAEDSRIRLLHNPRPGLVNALNLGLAEARGQWVARMDADDRMLPQRLARQVEHFRLHDKLVLSASRVRLFPHDQISDGLREYIRWQDGCLSNRQILDNIYVESPVAHPSVMFLRETVRALDGYRDGDFPEDYDLWLRLAQQRLFMEKLPQVLLEWRDQPERTSRTCPRYSRAAFDRLRAGYLYADARIQTHRNCLVVWGAGRRTRQRCRYLLQQGLQPLAWVDIDPRKIGRQLQGAPVVAPEWLEAQKPRPFVLVYVTNHGARELIGAELERMGYRLGQNYLAVG